MKQGKLTAELNKKGDQLTITVDNDAPQIFTSKKSTRAFLVELVKSEIINQKEAQKAYQTVHDAKNLPDVGPDDEDFGISVTIISFGSFSSFFGQAAKRMNTDPMETPELQMCKNCGLHGWIVDATGKGGRSNDLVTKQDGYAWVEWAKKEKYITDQQAKTLNEQIEKTLR